eukprot:s3782_g11.t1
MAETDANWFACIFFFENIPTVSLLTDLCDFVSSASIMSAVKLEKKVAALEKRLQDEMHAALEPLVLRLDKLEEHFRHIVRPVDWVDSTPEAKFEEVVSGMAIVPQPTGENEVKEKTRKEEKTRKDVMTDFMKLQLDNWTKDEPPKQAKDGDPEIHQVDGDEEPIPFAETIWNVVLVLGHSGAGWADVMVAFSLTVLGTVMQIVFVSVLLSDSFLGDPVEQKVEAARQWRAGSAHDVKHMDLALTSLVSRVCSGDGSLILSTGQADLIAEINSFLGIQDGGLVPQMIPPGTTLCMLCIGLWCVVLGGEFRAIATSLVAAAHIPRSKRTIMDKGSFVSISYLRFGSYLLFRLARTAVAACLLVAGTQWLARTSSISDLILNAVALEAILQIDELVFVALYPKKVQTAIYELEPVKIRYTERSGQLESCLVLVLFAAAVSVPFFLWVKPITDLMLMVKVEYCGGDQNFVVSLNQDVQMYMGWETVPYENVSSQLLGQLAVSEHSQGRLFNGTVSQYIKFALNLDTFEQNRFKSMQTVASLFPFCLDYDNFTGVLHDNYGAHFRAIAVQLGRGNATSCTELAEFCNDLGARLLRMVCGRTCRCADPFALPWFKVPNQGCPAVCREEALVAAAALPCTNANTTENFLAFWNTYPLVMSSFVGQDLMSSPEGPKIAKMVEIMSILGCQGLSVVGSGDMVTGASWCGGSDQFWSPLALICPQECGCIGGDSVPAYCSESCRACGDIADFPVNPVASNCAEAKANGICEVASEAATLCPETCGLCNATANVSAVCQDGQIPPEMLSMDCSQVQALGWCPPLVLMGSPVSRICSKSCGLCT